MNVGLNLDLLDMTTALVTDVRNGAIKEHNEKNPEQSIGALHRIVEVNGVRGDAKQIAEEIKRSKTLTMVLQKPPQEFEVNLNKGSQTTPLGVDLNFAPSSLGLLVLKVCEGPLQKWNDEQAALGKRMLQANDRIVSANGVRGTPADILAQIKGNSELKLTVMPFDL